MNITAGDWIDDENGVPDQYELVQFIAQGGEGQLWRTRRRLGNGKHVDWAVKVLSPLPKLDQGERDTLLLKIQESRQMVGSLGFEGIVGVQDAYPGRPPHPRGAHGPSGSERIYLVSRWVDGIDLRRWVPQNQKASLALRLKILDRLCAIVDRLASRGYVHRDLAPSNVMISETDHGAPIVEIIDFSSLRDVDAISTPGPRHGNWLSPDSNDTEFERDRYAVGTIASFLLSRRVPETGDVRSIHRNLRDAAFSRAVVDHVGILLGPGRDRMVPETLIEWADGLRTLLEKEISGEAASTLFIDIDVAQDGAGTSVVVASSNRGSWASRLGNQDAWTLIRRAELPGLRFAAAARSGRGEVIAFGLDERGDLWCIRAGGFERVALHTAIEATGGLSAMSSRTGDVVAVILSTTGDLLRATVRVSDDAITTDTHAVGGRRILDAIEAHGVPTVLIGGGALTSVLTLPLVGGNVERRTVVGRAVRAGALAIGVNGAVLAVIVDNNGAVTTFDPVLNRWIPGRPLATGSSTEHVAAWASRDQLFIAASNRQGLHVLEFGGRGGLVPQRRKLVLPGNVRKAVFTESSARQLRIVALTEESDVRVLERDDNGDWLPTTLKVLS